MSKLKCKACGKTTRVQIPSGGGFVRCGACGRKTRVRPQKKAAASKRQAAIEAKRLARFEDAPAVSDRNQPARLGMPRKGAGVPFFCSACRWRRARYQVQPRAPAIAAGKTSSEALAHAMENRHSASSSPTSAAAAEQFGVQQVAVNDWPYVCHWCFLRGGGPLQDSRVIDHGKLTFPRSAPWRKTVRRARRFLNKTWEGEFCHLTLMGESLPGLLDQVVFPAGPCALCGSADVAKLITETTGEIDYLFFQLPRRNYAIPLCRSCATMEYVGGHLRISVYNSTTNEKKSNMSGGIGQRDILIPDVSYLTLFLRTTGNTPTNYRYSRAFWAANWARAVRK